MDTSFAALLFRTADVSDRALSRGFAVALAGWDVPAPRLQVAPLPGFEGWSVAFYTSGLGPGEDALEHAVELFEDELSPAVSVLIASGDTSTWMLTLVFADDVIHDEGWRLSTLGWERRFVREGDEGLEAGVELSSGPIEIREVTVDLPDGASEAETRAAVDRAVRPHRGSTFVSAQLGAPVMPALMGALFAADHRIEVRLVDPSAESIAAETRRLNRALNRVDGRGAFTAPAVVAGVAQPAAHAAFVAAYDWADPADARDVYRELALGAVLGTLRFLRGDEIAAQGSAPGWADAARAGLYPLARLLGSALGGGGEGATLAVGADGEHLAVVRGTRISPAGPTFGELVGYLALGWSHRDEAGEDLIGALMLRARLRCEKD